MTIGFYPQRARHHQPILIHSQALDGGSAYRGHTLHTVRVLNPSEMILPALRAGVKQGHRCPSERIAGSG
jgi:hypothetical protein